MISLETFEQRPISKTYLPRSADTRTIFNSVEDNNHSAVGDVSRLSYVIKCEGTPRSGKPARVRGFVEMTGSRELFYEHGPRQAYSDIVPVNAVCLATLALYSSVIDSRSEDNQTNCKKESAGIPRTEPMLIRHTESSDSFP